MCKKCSEMLNELIYTLHEIEGDIRRVGHIAGPGVNLHIEQSLNRLRAFNDSLWAVDMVLKKQMDLKSPPTS